MRVSWVFIVMLVYFALCGVGLYWFWGFMTKHEKSMVKWLYRRTARKHGITPEEADRQVDEWWIRVRG